MKQCYKINITGIVQGVGFRPFVYNLAVKLNLTGYVLNDSNGVETVVCGHEKNILEFLEKIKNNAPPKSHINSFNAVKLNELIDYDSFKIKNIVNNTVKNAFVSPDLSICDDCLKELFDENSRRYYYPYINCTNCGPRYTIVKTVPYDRGNTTMSSFKMCPQCFKEYSDPEDRRFHAQPNACHVCGPSLKLLDKNKNIIVDTADSDSTKVLILKIISLLKEGSIIALKGLGGFHIVCDASNEKTVRLLRERKKRKHKAFAVMINSVKNIDKYAEASDFEKKRLCEADKPVLLLKKKLCDIADSTAPANKYYGIMLPYTPLHHLVLNNINFPLIMTSANISDKPIIYENEDAVNALKTVCDFFVLGSRDIYSRCDDSVIRIFKNKDYIIRRSRGITPFPVKLDMTVKSNILALGANQKNTVCFVKNDTAFISPHIGELNNYETYNFFKRKIIHLSKLFDVKPDVIVHDLHPGYLSTKYAEESDIDFGNTVKIGVQHHHAHIVSCMIDNNINDKVIGIVLDGTGYGIDGKIWGGEILVSSLTDFGRKASFKNVQMPGGEISIKKVWRMGLSYLYEAFKDEWKDNLPESLKKIPLKELEFVVHQIKNKYNSPLTSSCGRLFDGVSSLVGIVAEISYEAQAAIELEQLIESEVKENVSYDFNLEKDGNIYYIEFTEFIKNLIYDLKIGISKDIISYKFHKGLIKIFKELTIIISNETGIKKIVLTGGCFMNMFLLENLYDDLKKEGFEVFTHNKVPCNDGGISLGQAGVVINKLFRR